MLDYDLEAGRYDETRGGLPRAKAAAEAIARLLHTVGSQGRSPTTHPHPVLDIAGGTGIVGSLVAARGFDVVVCDRSRGMLRLAARRCPGRVVTGDATRLPVGSGRVGAITLIWLLHLLPDAGPVLAECARVLAPGGVLITTVDKDAGHDVAGDDISRVLAAFPPPAGAPVAADARARIESLARAHGLTPYAEETFVGHGQGRTPEQVSRTLEARPAWLVRRVDPTRVGALVAELRALPDPDRPRPAPIYTLVAFRAAAVQA